ncbi:MAG: putative peptidoglycan-binding domain-containing protein [Alphaproteobacteria bacterium]
MAIDLTAVLDNLIAREGGYVDHPADRGGPTRYGITEEVARKHGYVGDMRHFPRSEAILIYEREYWRKPGFNQIAAISGLVAIELLDTGVNMGTATAGKFLQRTLNALNHNGKTHRQLDVDGICGPATRQALKQFLQAEPDDGEVLILRTLEGLQVARYERLTVSDSNQKAFFPGWIRHRIALLPEA